MWNKITQSKIFYMVISIICAIACWLYVDVVYAPETPKTIYNIPVTVYGEDVLADEGLMITEMSDRTVTLRLEGPRSSVSQLDRNNIVISVQAASQISQEGEYNLEYSVIFPSNVPTVNVTVTDYSIESIRATVVQMTSKTLDIQGEFIGSAVEGAICDDSSFQFEHSTITLSGERSLLDQVVSAVVVLDAEDLSSTWTGELDIQLRDADGNPVDASAFTCDITSTYTVFSVKVTKEIPLSVNLLDGGGATEEDVDAVISPQTVMVTGTVEALEQIESINLGTISLEDVITSDTYTFEVTTPDDIDLYNGASTADVTVTVKDTLTTRTVEVTDIQLENVPEGLSGELSTQSVVVRIRGKAEIMSIVMDSDVYLTVDLSGYTVADAGTRTLNAKVHVKGFSDVGAIGDYTVVVVVSEAPQEPEPPTTP
ncbi:MAG: hypothetical protein IJ751_10360 [Oscillospiraceae bacterium]|nr:hypothetical protein [Oscillospiraceae bacterium]